MTHVPVLVEAVLEGLALGPAAAAVDCTFGRGGHARAMLSRMGPAGRVVAIDRDPDAIRAGLRLRDPRLELVQARFDALRGICRERDLAGRVDGVLFDLGVSSPQIEEPSRGFSIRREGPLDMRMDPGDGEPLGAWLDRVSERELAGVIARFGEERHARRIAGAIVRARPLATTTQLAAVVERAALSRAAPIHPATRTFQALRIHVNREIECLRAALPAAVGRAAPGRSSRGHQLPFARRPGGQAFPAFGVEGGARTPWPSARAPPPPADRGRASAPGAGRGRGQSAFPERRAARCGEAAGMLGALRSVLWPTLAMLLVLSALLVVIVKHESRKLFVELQTLERARDELNVIWSQLKIESGYLASHDRVRSVAETRLGMDRPDPGRMAIVNLEY